MDPGYIKFRSQLQFDLCGVVFVVDFSVEATMPVVDGLKLQTAEI